MNTADESFYSTLATLNVTEKGEVLQDVTKNTTHGQVSMSPWHICDDHSKLKVCDSGCELDLDLILYSF